jgi:hypothetical protein
MGRLWRMMTGTTAVEKVLLAAILLGLPGASAEAYTGPLSPSIKVAIAQRGRSEYLTCSVWQTSPPPGMSEILLRIEVPKDSVPSTILLKTTSDELALDVTNSLPLLGEYETIIDLEKTNCETSGTLFVDVEGDLQTKTATCTGIILPKASSCNE